MITGATVTLSSMIGMSAFFILFMMGAVFAGPRAINATTFKAFVVNTTFMMACLLGSSLMCFDGIMVYLKNDTQPLTHIILVNTIKTSVKEKLYGT